jgi:hypothetical protein
MKALDPVVLQSALEIQDELLGPTINFNPRRPSNQTRISSFSTDLTPDMRDSLHAINGLSNSSWFFHSPLQYWSSSAQAVADDQDIVTTVNEGSCQATSVNVTLRHSIVFSGKLFEDHRLVAADAVVITLIHMLDSPVGKQWERKAEAIASRASGRWRLYPVDGRSLASTLYEFRFQPLSFQDDVFLGIAYTFTLIYFATSILRMRALKSRLGVIVTVVSQIAISIMSSFTICAIFKIDLSKIPREAYPLVVLTVGLENISRLINAVIMTSPESPTAARMAEALGQTGHVAFAGVSQNLFILRILSKVVSPGVAAFCTFASIALTFDFFYLLTFFVAVLSVDVRRTVLSDSLTRVSTPNKRCSESRSQPRQTWTSALLRGETTVSTRIAGTVVMISFILIAQWHFFDNESLFKTVSRATRLMRLGNQPYQPPAALLSVDINQARTPTAWLRMQDHETAREVIKVIKPDSHSYIARVYDPLIFVLDGSDRTPNQFGIRRFLPAVYDFAKHQSMPFMVTVILLVAAVSLLMNYLLWDESLEDEQGDRPEDGPLLSVKTLSNGHALDIVLLTASTEGALVSVGLDRWIRVWDVRDGGKAYVVGDSSSDIDPFPVLAMAIDNDSNWLALLSSKDQVVLWNITEKRWGPTMSVEVKGRTPLAFFFGPSSAEHIDPVIVVRHSGLMTELHVEAEQARDVQICRSPLVSVRPFAEKSSSSSPQPPFCIITASKRGCIHVVTQLPTGWESQGLELPDHQPLSQSPCSDQGVKHIFPLPGLSSFLAVRFRAVELIDITTQEITHTFTTKYMLPSSLQCFHSIRRRPQFGSIGLASFALAYTCAETGECVLQTYLPEREGDTICLRDPDKSGSKICCLWRETILNTYTMKDPGEWVALRSGFVVGVRKLSGPKLLEGVNGHMKMGTNVGGELRRRGRLSKWPQNSRKMEGNPAIEREDRWEVWTLSSRGECSNMPFCNYDKDRDHLLVGSLGPIARVGKGSIAVGLGDVVKIVQVGNERFGGDEVVDESAGKVVGRKRKGVRGRMRSS